MKRKDLFETGFGPDDLFGEDDLIGGFIVEGSGIANIVDTAGVEDFASVVFQVADVVARGDGVFESLAVGVDEGAADAVGVFVIGVHGVVAEFVADIEEDEDGACEAEGESEDVEEGEQALAMEIAEGDEEVVAEHGEFVFCVNQ